MRLALAAAPVAALATAPVMALVTALVTALVLALTLCGCESPWDSKAAQVERRETVTHTVFADGATIGQWIDKRPKGQITHGMLVIAGPKSPSAYFPPHSTVEITTSSDGVAERIRAILAGEIPATPGSRLNFALGRTESVRIERIGAQGLRELVAEGRVSFLEVIPD
jgi:hypothetical protein